MVRRKTKEYNRNHCDVVQGKTKKYIDVVQKKPKDSGSLKKPAGSRKRNQAIVVIR